MKLNKFLIGLGALATLSLAACSNDEPINNTEPDKPVQGEGSNFYLNVNIIDANASLSRADVNDTPNTGDPNYAYGSDVEHKVNRADFLFYDGDPTRKFLARANVWKDKNEQDNPNVEFMGENTLVLRNLTKTNLPKYVITVLNAPKVDTDGDGKGDMEFSEYVEANTLTMEQTRMLLVGIRSDKGFVMTTTSFYGKPSNDHDDAFRYDDGSHYYTILDETDFLTEEPTPDQVENNSVKIYVERLAAKFTLYMPEGNVVDVTIAGQENNGNVENNPASANEKVYVELLGFGLTAQEKNSYLSKKIDGFDATTPWSDENDPRNGWNHPDYYRSYWAKSPGYGIEPDLNYSHFSKNLTKLKDTNTTYGYETTQKPSASKNFTHIVITARLYSYDKETKTKDKPLDLVEYNGVHFTKEQYFKYAYNTACGQTYYKNETSETVGNTITYHYEALTPDDFVSYDWEKAPDYKTGHVIFKATELKPNVTVYQKGADYTDGKRLEPVAADVAIEGVNNALKSFNNSQSPAIAFNSGYMYYTIPVKHILDIKEDKTFAQQLEGVYGVVRNHWYNTTVNKVITLGHGVFEPGNLDGTETGDEIIPDDPDKENFALAAQINILSWRIINQNIDI